MSKDTTAVADTRHDQDNPGISGATTKKNWHLLTAAELADMRLKAADGRRAANAARAASTLRKDFLDDDYWQELARRYAVRLPAWGTPITSGTIER